MKAKIIFYKQDKLDQNTKFKLRRELMGIVQKSNYSRYKYQIKGLLDLIPHYKPVDSAIIIENKHISKIRIVLNKYGVKYELFKVEIPRNKLSVK